MTAARATTTVISRNNQSGARKTASSTSGIRTKAVRILFMWIPAEYLWHAQEAKQE
jgi:hypothetical protein